MRRLIAGAIAALALVPWTVSATWTPRDAASRASSWLADHGGPDGSFGLPADRTLEAAASMMLAGDASKARSFALIGAVAYARAHGAQTVRDGGAGNAGRIVVAAVTLGQDPRNFGDTDYVRAITARYDAVSGSYDMRNGFANALAVLGLLASGEPVPAHAFDRISLARCDGGGYSSAVPCVGEPDVDTTAMVMTVLARAHRGEDPQTLARLKTAQNADGGFPAKHGQASNVNSTGLAISAAVLAGERPRVWARDPVAALARMQRGSGAFAFAGEEDAFATEQAIPGLLEEPYPLRLPGRGGASSSGAETMSSSTASPSTPAGSTHGLMRPACAGSGSNTASVTVVYNATVDTRCVAFAEPSISGLTLLERAGFRVVYQSYGGGSVFVCAIDGRGRDYPAESCVPPCPQQTDCTYWGYYRRTASGWSFADTGAGTRALRDGDGDGWRWGIQSTTGGCPPDPAVRCGAYAPAIDPTPAAASGGWGGAATATGAALLGVSMLALFGWRFSRRARGER